MQENLRECVKIGDESILFQLKKGLKYFKENLALMLILPTAIGGLWQILSLGNISFSLIRFFSPTQAIADGVLVLSLFATIYFSYFLSACILRSHKVKSDEHWSVSKSIFFFLCLSPFVTSSLWLLKALYSNPESAGPVILSFTLIVFFLSTGILFIGIVKLMQPIYSRSDKIRSFFTKNSDSIIYLLSTFSIIFFIYLLTFFGSVLIEVRSWSLNPSNIENWNNVNKVIQKKTHSSSTGQIVYFNDKYIFVRIHEDKPKNSQRILILKFEELFSENSIVVSASQDISPNKDDTSQGVISTGHKALKASDSTQVKTLDGDDTKNNSGSNLKPKEPLNSNTDSN